MVSDGCKPLKCALKRELRPLCDLEEHEASRPDALWIVLTR